MATAHAAPRRAFPSRLYAIADADVAASAGWTVPDLAEAFLDAGVRVIQIRAKEAAARDVLGWLDRLAPRAGEAWILTNDRVDLALVAGTRHVHLGQDDLPVADARALLGEAAIIGLSTHTVAQVDEAGALPLDYVAVGPVFGTATKATGYAAVGTALITEARRRLDAQDGSRGLPLVAIGGITLARAPQVIEAGASAVVVISDLVQGGNPRGRASEYLRALGEI
ncbi:thiamine-phosphate synthase [Luteitalea sp. TBR-22]|uniref:thiamine phosphate synthase n=1 Tax=Luteitalea sp. TBR-22 TaxID=2802971 RepID=UPI001AFC8AF4|nr:thiamine phosphate synthase [Luteitalea sp. TBR-22]BCS33849.1 thiamine-phosphate synthase [Luteitalea sp. TBR-22]